MWLPHNKKVLVERRGGRGLPLQSLHVSNWGLRLPPTVVSSGL